jgi:hypothetical protein
MSTAVPCYIDGATARPTPVGADNYSGGQAASREPVEDTVLTDDDSDLGVVAVLRLLAEDDRVAIGYARRATVLRD